MSLLSQLKLAAVSFNGEAVSPGTACCEFSTTEKITLGRNAGNNLVLDDPSRVISRVQASLSPKDSLSMHIVNLSASTSMFINAQELLPGEGGVLHCSDTLMVGAYLLQLSVNNIADNGSISPPFKSIEYPESTSKFIPEDADFFSVNNTNTLEPILTLHSESASFTEGGLLKSDNQSADFLLNQLLEKKSEPEFSTNNELCGAADLSTLDVLNDPLSSLLSKKVDQLSSLSGQDHSLEIESLFVAPRPMSTKPVDSGEQVAVLAKGTNQIASPVTAAQTLLPQATTSAEIVFKAGDDDCRLAFARALQMDIHKLPAFTPVFFEQLGGVLLHLTAGTVNMMHARAQVKHEMRADVTIIAASGNNPLKFAPDAQSAIAHLLCEPLPGFLRAKEAIDDAVDDLLAHQIGLVSGARAAVYEVMKNFSPEKMQKYLATKNIIDSLLPMAKRARLWELYETHYAEVAGSAREEFELRFQQAFAQAYEQEIDKMCAVRETV